MSKGLHLKLSKMTAGVALIAFSALGINANAIELDLSGGDTFAATSKVEILNSDVSATNDSGDQEIKCESLGVNACAIRSGSISGAHVTIDNSNVEVANDSGDQTIDCESLGANVCALVSGSIGSGPI